MNSLISRVPVALLAVAVAIPVLAATATASPAARSYVVVLKDEVVHPAYLAHRHERNRGAEITHIYGVALKGYSADLTSGQLKAIKKDPNVDYVESDGVIRPYGQAVGNQLKRVYANLSRLHIDENDIPADRVNADIAILDTGVHSHPDLNIVSRVVCVGGGGGCKPGQPDDDGSGHGTHVAGDAAAIDNGIGAVGTAPGARIWSVKVVNKMGHIGYDEIGMSLAGIIPESGKSDLEDGNAQMSDAIAGIDYVTAHSSEIEVANMSFACATDKWGCAHTALAEAIATSVNNGVVWVAAAGQEGLGVANNDYSIRHYPALLSDVITVSAMADYDGLPGSLSNANACPHEKGEHDDRLMGEAVGVEDGDDFAPAGSNYGPEVDMTAPGSCVFSTWSPKVYFNNYDIPYQSEYGFMNGSSVASALVAGAAADLTAQYNPNDRAGVNLIRNMLINSGNYNWEDLVPQGAGGALVSPDGIKEPLLDIGKSPPSATTTANPAVGTGSVYLDGWFNPNGADTRYYFQYGPTTAYGSTIPAMPGSGVYSGTAVQHAQQFVSGLGVNATYHYRLVAWSAGGTTYGADQAFTTAPYPVEGSTGSAEKVDLQGATLTASVSPRGANAYYKFEYGTSATPYSAQTSAQFAGSGSPVTVKDVVNGLAPNTVYHYRLIAWNAAGTITGADKTFRTAPYEDSSTWSVRTPSPSSNAWEWVFYRGSGGQLTERLYNGTSWQTYPIGSGQVSPGTTPAVVRVPSEDSNDKIWVFYRNAVDGKLTVAIWGGTNWTIESLNVEMAAGTSPSVVRSPTFDASDRIWVFTNGKNGKLQSSLFSGGGWANTELATQLAPGTSPAAVRAPSSDPNDRIWVFSNGLNGKLQNTYYAGGPTGGWANAELGTSMVPGTSPSVVRAPAANGFLGVFTNTSGRLGETYTVGAATGSSWSFADLGAQMEAGTSPAAVRAPTPETQGFAAIFTHGPKGPNGEPGRLGETYYNGSAWAFVNLGAQMEAGTSPSALRAPSLTNQGFTAVFTMGPKGPNGEQGRMGQTYYTTGWAFMDMGVPMFWF